MLGNEDTDVDLAEMVPALVGHSSINSFVQKAFLNTYHLLDSW